MEKGISATMPSSKGSAFKDLSLLPDENILDETQRLIKEAELKLRTMEGEMYQDTDVTRLNVSSSFNERYYFVPDV